MAKSFSSKHTKILNMENWLKLAQECLTNNFGDSSELKKILLLFYGYIEKKGYFDIQDVEMIQLQSPFVEKWVVNAIHGLLSGHEFVKTEFTSESGEDLVPIDVYRKMRNYLRANDLTGFENWGKNISVKWVAIQK